MPESESSTPNLLESAKADKASLALMLQRAQQNQEADQVVLDSNARWRENHHRLFEARMAKFNADGAGAKPEDDEMGRNILIDSPHTENHYHQPPPAASSAVGTLTKAALAAALLGGGGGAGYLLNAILNPSASTTNTTTTIENTKGFLIELVK